MGTPDFAQESLQQLLDSRHQVAGVFTQPDKPQGRKQILTAPPVKVLALEHQIPVYQPASLKTPEVLADLQSLRPDLIAVVAYGKILPTSILELPAYGCVNLHGSLLPKYRGAAPIQWSVLNGDAATGVTSMYMAAGLDTGDIIYQRETAIGENETSSELFDRLKVLGAELLVQTLNDIEAGTAPRVPQNDLESSNAPMLSREMSRLDFCLPAQQVHNRIRGLSDWPAAATIFHGKKLKIYRSQVADAAGVLGQPGELLDNQRMVVACGQGAVELLSVQLEGGKRLDAKTFLHGNRIRKGDCLGR